MQYSNQQFEINGLSFDIIVIARSEQNEDGISSDYPILDGVDFEGEVFKDGDRITWRNEHNQIVFDWIHENWFLNLEHQFNPY